MKFLVMHLLESNIIMFAEEKEINKLKRLRFGHIKKTKTVGIVERKKKSVFIIASLHIVFARSQAYSKSSS